MGGRKFKLAVYRKKAERKRKQKCEALSVQSKGKDTTRDSALATCPVSLPLAAFTFGRVQSLFSIVEVCKECDIQV